MVDLGYLKAREEGSSERDAVHVATVLVQATERLFPGMRVGFVQEDVNNTLVGAVENTVGIVDPFLDHPAEEGEWFWLLLYPNTITSLRHEWVHPAFNKTTEFKKARQWMEDFALDCRVGYEDLMQAASNWLDSGDMFCQSTEDGREEMWDNNDQFWVMYKVLTGTSVPEEKKENFFTCAC